jgi:hypothetical protein
MNTSFAVLAVVLALKTSDTDRTHMNKDSWPTPLAIVILITILSALLMVLVGWLVTKWL